MTLEEKSAQLCSTDLPSITEGRRLSLEKCEELLANGIGQISRVGGDTQLRPEEIAEITTGIQDFLAKKTRLGIPALIHEECLSGYMAKYSTMFPQAIAMAGTWNPSLVSELTECIRGLMRSVGIHQGLAPLLDVARDPRWGRIEETFGEDPYLVAAIGCAYIRGLQGGDLARGVIATGKHFVAYGIPDGGRNIAAVRVGPREMRDIYLFPFEAAVKSAALGSLMNAYHEIDGVPCVANRELLTKILRNEWGFDGIVVSDYGAIEMLRTWHVVTPERKVAAKMALEAGIDVELNTIECYAQPLIDAVNEGLISDVTVDETVRRVLTMKARLGLFREAGPIGKKATVAMFDAPANRDLAFRVAAESITLLKNDNGALPLPKDASSIAVIGPYADSRDAMLGDYSHMASMFYWRKAKQDYSSLKVVTALEGIRNHAPKGCDVAYAKGCDPAGTSTDLFAQAVEVAANSDAVVAVMGEDAFVYCGEGKDRDDLRLMGVQEDLVKELASTGVPVVLVILGGRPLALGGVDKYCAAVVEAWYPGEEGGNAVASILFGKTNPSGKLPASFPENVGQIPVHYSRKPLRFNGYLPNGGRGDARYPFGHGLSYTTFAYDDLEISPAKVKAGDAVRIRLTVENTGPVAGAEVVQLYITDVAASLVRPLKELKGFAKITLSPGEKKRVDFTLDTELLAFTGVDMRLVIEGGGCDVAIGASSEDIRLKGAFEVIGDKTLKGRGVFAAAVKVVKA
jgi:beta-glucosidase